MTLALTSFKAYGIEASEPLQKRFKQCLELVITGANTDATYDFGTYAGTFWTAVGGTEPGTSALLATKQIQTMAKSFLAIEGTALAEKAKLSTSIGNVVTYDSAASAGGGAAETLTVTGLAAADSILSVSQKTKGANSTALVQWTDTARTVNQLAVAWTADPGAGAIVRVAVRKAVVAAVAGQYVVDMNATNTLIPDVSFASGDAPTSAKLVLTWELPDGVIPIEADG